MLPLGHIAGIPVEETALSFGPVLVAGGGVIGLKLRDRWARIRRLRSPEKGRKTPLRRERPTA
jgi:hypothetical protein